MTTLISPINTTDLSIASSSGTIPTALPNAIYSASPVDPASVIKNNIQALSSITSTDYLDQRPKYYMSLMYGDFNGRLNLFQLAAVDYQYKVTLPLPSILVDNQSVAWDRTPLGGTGLALDAAMSATSGQGENQVKTNNALGEGGYLTATAAAGGGAAVAGYFVGKMLGKGAKGAIAGAGAAAGALDVGLGVAGYSPNQFLTILLRGPKYKEFSFEWEFSPKTENESKRLNTILTNLKNASAPSLALGGALFSFPKIFQLAFVPNPKYLFKFKPAVLEDIIVDYAAGGAPSFNRTISGAKRADLGAVLDPGDGLNAPSEFRVKMKFLELEFWLSGQYNESNGALDTHSNTQYVTTGLEKVINKVINGVSNVELPPWA